MAVVYAATLKTNRMQLVPDLIATKVAAASTGAGCGRPVGDRHQRTFRRYRRAGDAGVA